MELHKDREKYQRFREHKLSAFKEARAASETASPIPIKDLSAPSAAEIAKLSEQCAALNLCFYHTSQDLAPSDTAVLKRFGERLGLGAPLNNPCADANHISVLQNTEGSRFIPYTNAALNWHTDGYYYSADEMVRTFIMHCVTAAATGGSNTYLDHELLYILLCDEDPAYIEALSLPDAMTIPADGERPAQSGPVFAWDGGYLLMRYTTRTRNIVWHKECTQALACLREILQSEDEYSISHTLKKGEGVICHNVVHKRDEFEDRDSNPRTLFRARYPTRFVKRKTPSGSR